MSFEDAITISYKITFDNGSEREFAVNLDSENLRLLHKDVVTPPWWAKLELDKCPNCTLDPAVHKDCPVAVNLGELIDFLKDLVSHSEVEVRVKDMNREFVKRAPLQGVSSSLMGIIMVTSGCPILNKLRPMVETHLPFSSWTETTYRVVSMYLFAQYFRYKAGQAPDWDLTGLVDIFSGIEVVNQNFCRRLDHVRTEDACVNAVNILSSLGSLTKMIISENDLAHWEGKFMEHYGG